MNNKLDYIAIDFETANQYRNRACAVGLVRFEISYTDGAWNSFLHRISCSRCSLRIPEPADRLLNLQQIDWHY